MTVVDHIKQEKSYRAAAVDADGYLVSFDDWDESIAADLAAAEGICPLTEDKIEILKFIRGYYRKYGFFPILRAVCKNVNQPRNCMNEVFPNPLIAWKLAGLPHPDEPVISLLEAGQSPG